LEDDFELLLCNAAHVKNVPGRKTDISDSVWLCQLLEFGLLRASFVAPKPVRELRELTRRRRTLVRERAQEANRLHKTLEDTGVKLDCVASDILGVSGRSMLDALIAGQRDPQALAGLAKGRLRAKTADLQEAMEGVRFGAQNALLIGGILRHIDFLDAEIAALGDVAHHDRGIPRTDSDELLQALIVSLLPETLNHRLKRLTRALLNQPTQIQLAVDNLHRPVHRTRHHQLRERLHALAHRRRTIHPLFRTSLHHCCHDDLPAL
jgi:Transposase